MATNVQLEQEVNALREEVETLRKLQQESWNTLAELMVVLRTVFSVKVGVDSKEYRDWYDNE